MTKAFIRTLIVGSLACQTNGQEAKQSPAKPPQSIYDISHGSGWPHIGAPPPKGSAKARTDRWDREDATFTGALDALKRSWSGELPTNAADLRLQVGQFEDVVRAVTASGGFGNLVLADTARRLDLVLLSHYAVMHPSEHAIVADILNDHRVRLLDCSATGDMIMEELNLAPPSGRWRLSEQRNDLQFILHSNGSDFNREVDRTLLFPPGPGTIMAGRDVNFLMYRLAVDEETELSVLACFMEFLKRGGELDDTGDRSFVHVFNIYKEKFPFAPTGITGVPWSRVSALIGRARKWDGKPIPFSFVVGTDQNPLLPRKPQPLASGQVTATEVLATALTMASMSGAGPSLLPD
jgi:hypothetical protein